MWNYQKLCNSGRGNASSGRNWLKKKKNYGSVWNRFALRLIRGPRYKTFLVLNPTVKLVQQNPPTQISQTLSLFTSNFFFYPNKISRRFAKKNQTQTTDDSNRAQSWDTLYDLLETWASFIYAGIIVMSPVWSVTPKAQKNATNLHSQECTYASSLFYFFKLRMWSN